MTIKEKRYTAIQYELNNTINQGARGRAFELMCAREKSHKVSVAKQGQTDVSVRVVVNGKAKYLPAECKTNGGRVNALINPALSSIS